MMRCLLVFMLVGIAQLSFGQSADSVSKIVIEYSKGNAWGDTLQIGKSEIIEISPVNDHNFKITRHFFVNHYGKPNWRKDTIPINVVKYPLIEKNKISYLFEQFNSTKDNFNTTFIKPRIRCPKKSEILKIVKGDTATYWKFLDKGYLENSERRDAMRKIRRFDKLDTFLFLNKPDPERLMTYTDVWDAFRLFCITKKDTIIFQSYTFNLLCQPFEKYRKGDLNFTLHGFVNLEMDTSLQDILPKKSLFRERLDLNTLTEQYIKWYLKEKL